MNATVASVFFLKSKLEDIVMLEEEQRPALKAFLVGQHCFTSLLTLFGKSFVKHGGT